MLNKLRTRARARRNEAAFDRALRQASPSMRNELVAMATQRQFV